MVRKSIILKIIYEKKNQKTNSTKNIFDQKYSWRRGGNATNNCTVLKQLGTNCEFYGTLRNGFFLKLKKFLKL